MRPFARGQGPPGRVRSAVPGRVLAATEAVGGSWLAGTRDALYAVSAAGAVELSVPWERVQRADWDVDTSTFRVEQVEDYGLPVRSATFELDEPGLLLQLVRERVSASVLLHRRVELQRRRGLSVIARRAPSGQGEVTWAYEFDLGVDPADPSVMAAAERALGEAQESLGL